MYGAAPLTDANALAALPEVYFIRATRIYYIDPVSMHQTLPEHFLGW